MPFLSMGTSIRDAMELLGWLMDLPDDICHECPANKSGPLVGLVFSYDPSDWPSDYGELPGKAFPSSSSEPTIG